MEKSLLESVLAELDTDGQKIRFFPNYKQALTPLGEHGISFKLWKDGESPVRVLYLTLAFYSDLWQLTGLQLADLKGHVRRHIIEFWSDENLSVESRVTVVYPY